MERKVSEVFFQTQSNRNINQESQSLARRKSLYLMKDEIKNGGYSSMFLKSKQQSKQRIISPELESLVGKIQNFVEDIDGKIQNRVQLVKHVYLNEYKQQVLQMSTQLKILREKLDNQAMKEKANQKMFYLQQERDFFRHEVIKLNEQMNLLNEQNKSLRRKVEEEKRQLANYKNIVYNLQEKLLKVTGFNSQRNKLFQTQTSFKSSSKIKEEPSTIETKKGALTQRVNQRQRHTLQTIQDESSKQISVRQQKLRESQSLRVFPKMSSGRDKMRSTVKYPRLTVQKLQKIEGYSQVLQKQQIVEECINELKRQIFYRNLSVKEKQTKIHFNEAEQVSFEAFTKTDKKELIVKILSNEKILHQFYDFMFNHNYNKMSNQILSTEQLINNKLQLNFINSLNPKYSLTKLKFSDPKFNTQQLNQLKTQFNKKIFQIKHNL